LPELFQAEFTGERIVPGLVDENLFNEHLARYRFTLQLVRDLHLQGRFLDAGCGTGYGSAALADTGARVLGIDVAAEAVAHARANYGRPGLEFEEASCTAIPATDGAFQLITAFEVIEHIPDWREFLREARRVIDPAGIFVVSTPNRLYYAESREKIGPNPFHVHEFTADEFRAELTQVFPHVKLLLQNHVEGIAFAGAEAEGAAVEISEQQPDPDAAHFFLAICSMSPLPRTERFVFIPDSGNVLKTRERHIALLDGEIAKKNEWIQAEKIAHAAMIEKVAAIEAELSRSNEWAKSREKEAVQRGERIEALQQEVAKATEWARTRDELIAQRDSRVVELQDEVAKATEWARTRDEQIAQRDARVLELQDEVVQANEWAQAKSAEADERGERVVALQAEVEQASNWAQSLDAERANVSAGYEAAIAQWTRDKEASDRWAIETEQRLSAERDQAREAFAASQIELEISQDRVASLEAQKGELQGKVAELERLVAMIAQSRWVKLGRAVRVGPEIEAH
jgi:SAM-dependent methyltransferase